jgi:hypothetical protein
MNILSRDQQIAAVSALTEGCSIRATERLTGIHRDTIMRLGVHVGEGCAALPDEMMRFVQVNRLELDELWSYVGKKQRTVKQTDPADVGGQYVFIGIDATRKAIISYRVGKRDSENTVAFLADLRQAKGYQGPVGVCAVTRFWNISASRSTGPVGPRLRILRRAPSPSFLRSTARAVRRRGFCRNRQLDRSLWRQRDKPNHPAAGCLDRRGLAARGHRRPLQDRGCRDRRRQHGVGDAPTSRRRSRERAGRSSGCSRRCADKPGNQGSP